MENKRQSSVSGVSRVFAATLSQQNLVRAPMAGVRRVSYSGQVEE